MECLMDERRAKEEKRAPAQIGDGEMIRTGFERLMNKSL